MFQGCMFPQGFLFTSSLEGSLFPWGLETKKDHIFLVLPPTSTLMIIERKGVEQNH